MKNLIQQSLRTVALYIFPFQRQIHRNTRWQLDIKPLTKDLNILHDIEQEKSFKTEQENVKHEVHDPESPNPKTCSLARTTKKYK